MRDLAIVGGGPAGLSVAIRAAQRGFSAVVIERSAGVPDKACGEGLMPRGLRELRALGVRIPEGRPFPGIRYVQEDGTHLEGRFREGDGLGVRRLALMEALLSRAREAGVELVRADVQGLRITPGGVAIAGPGLEARLAVAADGLHSRLRKDAGLEAAPAVHRRYGLRRHVRIAPFSSLVEVHWAAGAEAYVTPVGPESVNVAFLFERETAATFEKLLSLFPALQDRIAGAPFDSEARGAGPLLQGVRALAGPRLALVGDAAGYVDAITGQGLSLAFTSAAKLVASLPMPLEARALAAGLRSYQRSLRADWLRYALPARALLALSRRPRLRRLALRACARVPPLFPALLSLVE